MQLLKLTKMMLHFPRGTLTAQNRSIPYGTAHYYRRVKTKVPYFNPSFIIKLYNPVVESKLYNQYVT